MLLGLDPLSSSSTATITMPHILADKTSTLTLNQMKVSSVWIGKDLTLNVDQDENKKMKPIGVAAAVVHPHHLALRVASIAVVYK